MFNIENEKDLKRYLGRAHKIRRDLRALNRRMLELRSRTLPGSPSLSDMPKSGEVGSFARYSDEIIMMLQDAEERAQDLVKAEKEIEAVIYLLPEGIARTVMYEYYINDLPIESREHPSLEKEYFYSPGYIKHLLHKGRKELLDIIFSYVEKE